MDTGGLTDANSLSDAVTYAGLRKQCRGLSQMAMSSLIPVVMLLTALGKAVYIFWYSMLVPTALMAISTLNGTTDVVDSQDRAVYAMRRAQ